MAENTIQVSLVAFSDNSYNAPLASVEYGVMSASVVLSYLLQATNNPRRTLRRYSVDPIAGTYIDEFDITHNKFDTWDIHTLIWFVACATTTQLRNVILKAAIGSYSFGMSQVAVDLHSRVAIYMNTLGESSYTFPVFYRTRRINLTLAMASIFQFIEDVQRTRSLYSAVRSESSFEWTNPYLFLKHRIYMGFVATAILELLFTLWKEGNPAIRIEPVKWYKKRLDAGEIIIKENPWI